MSDKPVGVKRTRIGGDDTDEPLPAKKKKVKKIWVSNKRDASDLNFVWTIENFNLLSQGIDEEISSPEFSYGSNMHHWRLKLYLKGQHSCQGYMAIYLFESASLKKLPTAFPTLFTITLLNSKREVLTSYIFSYKMFVSNNSFVKGLLKIEDVFPQSDLQHCTDKLHVHCQVVYETKKILITGLTVPQISTNSASKSLESHSLKQVGQLLYVPTTFSDLEIRVRGVNFSAHKNILAASSPFFRDMFQSDGFTEQRTNILNINDLEPQIVKEMLRFLYMDRVEKMDELAIGLLVAADKYMIDLLKTQCQAALTQTITVENCCQLLALGDSHSASDLKTVASRFVTQHISEVSTTVGWKELKQTHPHLGFQLVETNLLISNPQLLTTKCELNKQHTALAYTIERVRCNMVMESDNDLFDGVKMFINPPLVEISHRDNSKEFSKKIKKRPVSSYLPLWKLENTLSYCYSQVVKDPMALRQYRPFSSEVYGEASFANIAKMIELVKIKEDEIFIDLGSGIGQVVIQVAASTICKKAVGIEFKEIPSRYAEELSLVFNKIVEKNYKHCSPFQLIHGDFLDEQYNTLISSANVIFMNNVLFDSFTINQLKAKFQNLEDGARIVVTSKFPRYSTVVNERNCLDLTSILSIVAKFDGEASWAAKHVTFYVYIVDRTKLKDFLNSKI